MSKKSIVLQLEKALLTNDEVLEADVCVIGIGERNCVSFAQ